ncbi:MAG: NTP transferase domain-containing protein [Trueperaceae bacterium]
MDAVCLAAGRGTRFGELGRYLQKAMYPVGLRPFLDYTVENLAESGACRPGVDRLTLIVEHHQEQVRAWFGARAHGLEVRYLEQPEPRGTGQALTLAAGAARDRAPVLCWLADAYVPTERFRAVADHPARRVLTVAPAPEGENAAVRVDLHDGRVVRAYRGAGPLSDVGLWKLDPATMAELTHPGDDGEIRALPNLQRLLDRDPAFEIGAVTAPDWWHLGGTAPDPETNLARVVARVRAAHLLPATDR